MNYLKSLTVAVVHMSSVDEESLDCGEIEWVNLWFKSVSIFDNPIFCDFELEYQGFDKFLTNGESTIYHDTISIHYFLSTISYIVGPNGSPFQLHGYRWQKKISCHGCISQMWDGFGDWWQHGQIGRRFPFCWQTGETIEWKLICSSRIEYTRYRGDFTKNMYEW